VTALGVAALVVGGVAGAVDNAGGPSFAAAPVVAGGPHTCAAVTADFNADTHSDLAVADCKAKTIRALLGDGAGRFNPAAGSPIAVSDEARAVAVDLNRDAKTDLAVLGRNKLSVLLGDGSGRFDAAPGSPLSTPEYGAGITAADMNVDGRIDLVVGTSHELVGHVLVLLGNGSGGFVRALHPVVIRRDWPSPLLTADFDGDARPDLAAGDSEDSKTTTLLGDGAGGFRAARTLRIGLLAAGDFDRDGKVDLAGSSEAHGVGVLRGNGGGRFRPLAWVAVGGSAPRDAVAGDLDGDRRLDLAFGNERGLTVLLGNGKGRFRRATDSPFVLPHPRFSPDTSPFGLLGADFNHDGLLDLAARADSPGLIVLWQAPSTPPVARGGSLPGPRASSLSTRGQIGELAVDGKRVAVSTAGKGFCGSVVVWTARAHTAKAFKTDQGCDEATNPYHVVQLALGGGQVAWLGETGGNSLEMILDAAPLSGGRKREVAETSNNDGASGELSGGWFGQLLGEGPLLVYNSWRVTCKPPPDYGCWWGEPTLRLVRQRLNRLVSVRRVTVKRGSGSYPVTAVGGGRMAVEAGGVVTLLATGGGRVAAVPAVEGNPPRALALSRTRLIIERTFEVDVHDPANGAKSKSIALGAAAGLTLVGVNRELALLSGPSRLVLVRLRDGKLISLAYPRGSAGRVVGARLTEAGLFYAYNVRKGSKRGRIAFVPTGNLLARF
jgi:hypothetical protein